MSATDRRILRWERKLLLYGRTDRGDYIVHMLNLLRARKVREQSDPTRCACGEPRSIAEVIGTVPTADVLGHLADGPPARTHSTD